MKINDYVFDGVSTTPWKVTNISDCREFVTAEKCNDDKVYFVNTATRNKSYWLPKPYYITVHDNLSVYPSLEVLASSELEVKQETLKILQQYNWKDLKCIRVNGDNSISFEDGVIVQYTGTASSMITVFEVICSDAIKECFLFN